MKTSLAALRTYNRAFAARCNSARWFKALFHVEVEAQLIAEVDATQTEAKDKIYSVEQADLSNAQELHAILADGKVTPDELTKLAKIEQRQVNGAAKLHDVTEVLAV